MILLILGVKTPIFVLIYHFLTNSYLNLSNYPKKNLQIFGNKDRNVEKGLHIFALFDIIFLVFHIIKMITAKDAYLRLRHVWVGDL